MPAYLIARRKGVAPVCLPLPENIDAAQEAFLWSQLEARGSVSKGYGHPPASAVVFGLAKYCNAQAARLTEIGTQFADFTPEPRPNITPEPDKARAPEGESVAQVLARPFFAIARDKFFAGWGKAKDKTSIFVIACRTLDDAERAEKWLADRKEMRSARIVQKYKSKDTEHVAVTPFEYTGACQLERK